MRSFLATIITFVMMLSSAPSFAQIMSNPFESWRIEIGVIPGLKVPNESTPPMGVGIHGDTGFDAGAVVPLWKGQVDLAFGGSYQKAGITVPGSNLGDVTSKSGRVSIRYSGFNNAWWEPYAGVGARYIDVGGTLGGGNFTAKGSGIYPMVEVGFAVKLPFWVFLNVLDVNFSHSKAPKIDLVRFGGVNIGNIKYNSNVVAIHLSRSF